MNCKILATAPVTPYENNAPNLLSQLAEAEELKEAENKTPAEKKQISERFRVTASNKHVRDYDAEFLVKCFIELFPFYRGGPNEKRRVPVGKEACVAHFMRLSTRAFRGYRCVLAVYTYKQRERGGRGGVRR